MSDSTVLTSLCIICHTNAPKYRCPGCNVRTCSLPCVQKHKARADCSGERNARAFIPLSKLRTPAGIDHDFNFITSIERARERTEKELVEVRKILSEKDIQVAQAGDKAFNKVWYGDELRHVPVPGVEKEGLGFDRHVRRRLRQLDVETIMMPRGMKRSRENETAWNRRTLSVNWQVEWIVEGMGRVLRKSLEGKTLCEAFDGMVEWRKGMENKEQQDEDEQEEGPPRKKRKHKKTAFEAIQDSNSSAWTPSLFTMQHSITGAWSKTANSAAIPSAPEERAAGYTSWQFFLLEAPRPGVSTNGKRLIPLSSTETLAQALSGRTVLEFPTIYVFPPSAPLPDGFLLGSTEVRKRRREGTEDDDSDSTQQPPQKKQRFKPAERPSRGKCEPRGGRGGRDRGGRGGRGTKRVAFDSPPPPGEDSSDEGEINSDGDAKTLDKLATAVKVHNQQLANSDIKVKSVPKPVRQGTGKVGTSLVSYDSSDSE